MSGTRTPAIALVIVVLTTLAGCASTPAGATLADSKGLVQLVRNEAGQRLPDYEVENVELVDDGSEACKDEADDPEGLERRWVSTLLITLAPTAANSLESTYSELIESFVGNGWSEVSYGGDGATELQKPDQDASIAFAATKADPDAATPPTIGITIHSACVTTAGAESDEVLELESVQAE